MSDQPEAYLKGLYRWLMIIGFVSFTALIVFGGWASSLSFAAGWVAILILFLLWHLTVALGTSGKRPRAAIVGLLTLLRYALIGGLVYGIMRLLGDRIKLEWAWFFVGICTFLPSLVINDLTTDKQS